ncbi:hypothetical protein HPB47_011156 [Ixodes persulcatus]|uniref:Uncharacterized protein n=1 Tax=Ixodes persulcatus TaxID=34615 RepID=A0AC60NX58_IXOPE|nr:hypothetical protein HPB47_011156 [Ixodes persulcatus]
MAGRLSLNAEKGGQLGLTIRGGLEYGLGVFVTAVDPESAADLAGLQCTDLQRKLGTKDAWQFLRHVLDPSESKRITSQTLQKIVRHFPGTNQILLEQLKQRYIDSSPDEENHDHEGEPDPYLDVPFSFEEVWNALQDLGRNTAPGQDRVQSKLLQNLDTGSVHTLLKRINQSHLEETGAFSHTMFDFRKHLSTQDVMLQLKEDIIGPTSKTTTQAVLALDVKGAFVNAVVHDVQRYIRQGHLRFSAAKSELILVCKTPKSSHKPELRDEMQVSGLGSQIPVVSRARILGLSLQEDGKPTHTLRLIQNQVIQILRIMPRVASRWHNLIKDDTITLVIALVLSRIIQSTRYLNLAKGDEDKLVALIRKVFKTSFGLHGEATQARRCGLLTPIPSDPVPG